MTHDQNLDQAEKRIVAALFFFLFKIGFSESGGSLWFGRYPCQNIGLNLGVQGY